MVTNNLELNGHDAEVENLHGRPQEIVRFERRNVDVAELVDQGIPAAAFRHRHEGEETEQTCTQLVNLL